MKKLDSGINYVRYAIGEFQVVALRDGHVNMPASRLRQTGDRPFGSDLPAQVRINRWIHQPRAEQHVCLVDSP